MNCFCNHLKLPTMEKYEQVKCIKISMSNGEEYTIKTNDMVAIQFVKDDKRILVRRGRIKDFMIVNRRCLSTCNDNVSHIILDCSQQYTIKIIEIKLKDIIKIGNIDDEFEDYSDRITELHPDFMVNGENNSTIPVRHQGMITQEEMIRKVTKPERSDVVKMDPETGVFRDLYDMNMNRPDLEDLKITPETEDSNLNKSTSTTKRSITTKGIPLCR